MTPRGDMDALDIEQSPEAILSLILDTQHSRFPVIEGSFDQVHGLVLVKDLYRALLAGDEQPWAHLKDFCRPAQMLPDTLNASQLFEQMRSKQLHMALIVDEYGEIIGLITLEDVLEELVGDIGDELDEQVAEYPIESIAEGQWRAHGLAALDEVSKLVGLEAGDVVLTHTLSGLFMERLGRMPEAGDQLLIGQLQLTVGQVKDRRVEWVDLQQVPQVQTS